MKLTAFDLFGFIIFLIGLLIVMNTTTKATALGVLFLIFANNISIRRFLK